MLLCCFYLRAHAQSAGLRATGEGAEDDAKDGGGEHEHVVVRRLVFGARMLARLWSGKEMLPCRNFKK